MSNLSDFLQKSHAKTDAARARKRKRSERARSAQEVWEKAEEKNDPSKAVHWGTANRCRKEKRVVPPREWLLFNEKDPETPVFWGAKSVPVMQRQLLADDVYYWTKDRLKTIIVPKISGNDIRDNLGSNEEGMPLRPLEFYSIAYTAAIPTMYEVEEKDPLTNEKRTRLHFPRTEYIRNLKGRHKRHFGAVRRNANWAVGFEVDGVEYATTYAQLNWAMWSEESCNTEACRVRYPAVRTKLDAASKRTKAEKRKHAVAHPDKKWKRRPVTEAATEQVHIYHVPGGFRTNFIDFSMDATMLGLPKKGESSMPPSTPSPKKTIEKSPQHTPVSIEENNHY